MAKGQAAQPIAPEDDTHRLAQTVRESSIRAALDGYERAGLGGLCAEGRWEMAIDAMRALDLDAVVHGFQRYEVGQTITARGKLHARRGTEARR